MEFTIDTTRYTNIENFLKHSEIELENIQSYFPTLIFNDNKYRIKKWNSIKLENRLIDVISTNNNNYRGIIEDLSGNYFEKNFHVKCTPIIEPKSICQKTYAKFNECNWLPNDYTLYRRTIDKVNNIYNSAYTDSLCNISLSKLKDSQITNHFGSVYATYNGILKDYEDDITDEYSMYNEDNWFKHCLKSGKYKLKKISNEKELTSLEGLEKCDLDKFAHIFEKDTVEMIDDDDDDIKYILICPEVPVQIVLMEKFDYTFDKLIKDSIELVRIPTRYTFIRKFRERMVIKKLTSWIFQICAGLSSANKAINFVHNDLHVQNVMGKKTKLTYLYYKVNNNLYKVPTYGYIMNIIDFGRSTFTINNQTYIGDVFDDEGDAGGQYALKYNISNKTKIIEPKPHYGFDLARFACSFIEDLDNSLWPSVSDLKEHNIGILINSWTYDDNGESLLDIEGFDLYVHISNHFRSKTPDLTLLDASFIKYIVNEIPDESAFFPIYQNII